MKVTIWDYDLVSVYTQVWFPLKIDAAMKKFSLLLGFSLILFLAACSKSGDDSEMDPDQDPLGNAINYQDNIRPIITANCVSCHGNPPTNGAPMSLTTYNAVRSAVETRGLLSRINSTTNPMPPNGRMPASTIQIIEDWADQGFLEN